MVEKERKKTNGWTVVLHYISYPLSLYAALRRNGSNSNNFQTLIIEYIKKEEEEEEKNLIHAITAEQRREKRTGTEVIAHTI